MNQKALAVSLLLLTLSSCSDQPVSSFTSPAAEQAPLVDLRVFVTALIDGHDPALGAPSEAERSALDELYQPDRSAVWLDAAGRPAHSMRDALTMLSRAADEGLDPADYRQEFVNRLAARLEAGTAAPQELAQLDVALSAGLLRYLRDMHIGRVDPRKVGFRLDVPRDQHDFAAMLRSAIADDWLANVAADLQPPLMQYRLLRSTLSHYRSLAADPTLLAPQSMAGAIHPEEPYRDAGVLRRLLIALGDLPPDATASPDSGRYEGALVEGVKHFQERHGLEPDGVVGRGTFAALRVPLKWRVRQIELALERLRWLPHLGDERLIALNIPMFRLWAWGTMPPSGTPLFGMDAIVGRALRTQTPVFVEEMREVIFRPFWNVPPSILRNEILPQIERDPDYLRRENMEIVRGAGDDALRVEPTFDAVSRLKQGALRLRQRPGPGNALGLIKFAFPNEEGVYMHGTPAQALFQRSRRDFSHGCVRVADPVTLAEWVLQDQPAWTRERIVAATKGTETVHVGLPRPVKVILFYTTAAVMPENGEIRFAEDIYGHDVRLDRALTVRRLAQ